MQWVDGFERSQQGQLVARLRSKEEVFYIDSVGDLAVKGIARNDGVTGKAFTSNFTDWTPASAERYLAGFEALPSHTNRHTVFSLRHGRTEFLVPALVLLRGIFPHIPSAFEYLFTAHSLESLCVPLERNGHWTVAMPDFRGYHRGRFRPATVESLTWASLFPSAHQLWTSVYGHCCNGRINLDLPKANVRILSHGIRVGAVVHVTALDITAVEALEPPFEYASGASPSFLWNRNATPLAPNPNAYYEQGNPAPEASEVSITDDEWTVLGPLLSKPSTARGRKNRDSRRAIADGLLLRLATGRLWADIATAPLTPRTLEDHWYEWRRSGQLTLLVSALKNLRPDASYLDS